MRLTAICVVVMLAQVIVVHGDCKGKCNIVYCGQSGDSRVYDLANVMMDCYPERGTTGICRSKGCNLGTVFYKNATSDKDVCAMSPSVDFEAKYQCLLTAAENQDDTVVTDNKLELCFQKANQDPGLMGNTTDSCTYTVVVMARNDLTNSDVTTLKAEAKKLTDKGAKIRCYVVGDDKNYDENYNDICDDVTKLSEYDDMQLLVNGVHFIQRLYDDIKCCPEEIIKPTAVV